MKKMIVFLMLSVLGLGGCGSDGGDGAPATVLEGTWSRGCASDGGGDYDKITTTYSGSITNSTYSVFSAIDCSAGSAVVIMSGKGTFTVGEDIVLPGGDSATKLNENYSSILITLFDASYIASFNQAQLCGKSNWEAGKQVEIAGCSDLISSNLNFDIFKINGNKLFFGDTATGEGISDATRPTQLETIFQTKN